MKRMFVLFALSLFVAGILVSVTIAGEDYVIQKGDTLWDISDSQLQDNFLWPKLWNVNPQIENPDLIYPGNTIVIPSREELMKMTMPEKPQVFKPRAKVKKMAPQYAVPAQERKNYLIDRNAYIASGWIAAEFPGVGEIAYSPIDKDIVGEGDTVYLKINSDHASDKRFFTIRDIKEVRHPGTGKKMGHLMRVTGILEVNGMDNNMPKAVITSSFEEIHTGEALLPYQDMEPPLAPEYPRTPNVSGLIVESNFDNSLTGEGDIVFLDKGKSDGLEIGDIFSVTADSPPRQSLGTAQVVTLQQTTAAAVIRTSSSEIMIGSEWGKK